MRSFIFALPLAAAASLPTSKLQTKAVLPLSIDPSIASGSGFNSLADTLISGAQSLDLHADNIDAANSRFSADVSDSNAFPNIPVSFQLAQTLANVNKQLWSTTYEAEKKVCAIASSITSQNVDGQKANLINGINAEARSALRLETVLASTISTIQSLSSTFSDNEKAIFTAAINNLAKSSEAASGPLSSLAEGLKSLGLTDVIASVADLKGALAALSQTAANVQIS